MKAVIRLTEIQLASLCRAQDLDNLLTPTERRIAKMATLGYIKEIANLLGNSPKTVKRHIESITNKARRIYGKRHLFAI
jgi:DNA-binding CsgD family transcriptional regulator